MNMVGENRKWAAELAALEVDERQEDARRAKKPLMSKVPPKLPTYVFKLLWRGTSKTIKVVAKDYLTAVKKAESQTLKMEGGIYCMDIKFVERRG